MGKASIDEALAVHIEDYLDEQHIRATYDAIRAAIATGDEVVTEQELNGLSADGKTIYLRSTMRVIASTKERYLFYNRLENITQQREAENKERVANLRTETIMQNINGGIIALYRDESGVCRTLFANEHFYSMRGYTRESYQSEVYDPLLPIRREDRQKVDTIIEHLINIRGNAAFEYDICCRNGNILHLCCNASVTSVFGIDSDVLLLVTTDVSDFTAVKEYAAKAGGQLKFLNETAHILLTHADGEAGIKDVLRRTMEYFSAQNAYIVEFDYNNLMAQCSYEICSNPTQSKMKRMRDIPLNALKGWLKVFEKGKHIFIGNAADLDDSHSQEKVQLLENNIKSFIAIPMQQDGKLLGFFGLNNPTLNTSHIDELDSIGDYLAVTLIHRDMEQQITNDNEMQKNLMNDMPGGFTRMKFGSGNRISLVFANEGFCELINVPHDRIADIYTDNATERIHPDDRPAFERELNRARRENGILDTKFRLKTGIDGDYILLHSFGRVTKGDDGKTYINLYYTEVSAADKLEEQRKQLMNNLPCGAAIYGFRDGKITPQYYNDRYLQLIGRKSGDFSDISATDVIMPEERDNYIKKLTESIEHGDSYFEINLHIIHNDGKYRSFRNCINIVRLRNGGCMLYTTYTPVTDGEIAMGKMLPVALQTMRSSTNDLSFLKDVDLSYICCSKPFAKMVGLNDESEVVGKTDYDLFDKKLAEKYRADDYHLMKDGKSLVDYVERIPSDDGTVCYSSTSKHILRDEFGNVVGLYGVGRNMTGSKETLAKLDLLNTTIPVGLGAFVVSPSGVKTIYLSDTVYSLADYDRNVYTDMSKEDALSLIFEEDRADIEHQNAEMLENGTPINAFYRIKSKKGIRWINLKGTPARRDKDGVILHAVMIDVTEQKETELKLTASHNAMMIAGAADKFMLWTYDIDEKMICQDFGSVFGLVYPETVRNVPDTLYESKIVAPDDEETFSRMYDELLAGAQRSECTVKILNNDTDKYEWQHIIYTRMQDENARKAIGFAMNVDIEQKNRLRYEREFRFRQGIVRDSVVFFRLNLTRGIVEEYVSKFKDSIAIKNFEKADTDFCSKVLELVAEEDIEAVVNTLHPDDMLKAYREGKNHVSLEFRRKTGENRFRWIKCVSRMMKNPDSEEVIAFVSCTDIDEDKKDRLAMETILEEEIESVAIISTDCGQAHYVRLKDTLSSVTAAYTPFDYDEIHLKEIQTVVPDDDKEKCYSFFCVSGLQKALETEAVAKVTYKVISPDGEFHRKKSRAFYLDDTHADIVVIRRDISDLYLEEQRQKKILEDTIEIANKANHAKSEFLSRMSHDMRTPLNAMLAFSCDEITETADEPQLRDFLNKIHSSGNCLTGMINDVLDMSHIEQKKVLLNPTPYLFTDFMDTINSVIGTSCKEKNIDFFFPTDNMDISAINVDRVRFNQIFLNLLSNAVKFTPPGGKVEFIISQDSEINGRIAKKRFVVRDNGKGMSDKFVPHAFESFTREENDNFSEKESGTGLGLSIVKEIVPMMGGEIHLESKIGKGTTVTVVLPLEIASTAPSENNAEETDMTILDGLNVLVCEDNALNREIVACLLEKKGCTITFAENGKRGVELFEQSGKDFFDAVLMDIRMPVMNGLDATKAIRALERHDAKEVPIIALTADAFSEDEQTSLSSGMNAHIAKPVSPDLLYFTLCRQAEARKRRTGIQ